jgi:hemoglobin-like flavoprotein
LFSLLRKITQMKKYRELFNNSYQRAISPDYHGFFERFYELLLHSDPKIEKLFEQTNMENQTKMLMQSMTYITSFGHELKPSEEMENIAVLHGKKKLNIPASYYDLWLNCMLLTVAERDPEYNTHVDTAWRVSMTPGIEYMKSFCDHNKSN